MKNFRRLLTVGSFFASFCLFAQEIPQFENFQIKDLAGIQRKLAGVKSDRQSSPQLGSLLGFQERNS